MDTVNCATMVRRTARRRRARLPQLALTLAGTIVAAVAWAATAPSATTAFPSFPQHFSVQAAGHAAFPLAISQPGPVVIDVDASGAPIVVTLQGRTLAPLQQQGAGHVHLSYVVTPADLQHTSLWAVSIALAAPGAPGPQSQAQGTISVQQPPGDQAAAIAEANSVVSAAHNRPRPAPELAARLDAARASLQAQADHDAEQRRSAVRAAQQPMIDQLWGRQPSAVGTRSLPALTTIKSQPVSGVSLQPIATSPPTLTVAPPPPAPVITNVYARPGLSPTQAGPLDQVTIVGQNFGSTPADVVFQVGPNTYLPTTAVPGGWNPNGTSIVVMMPDASGLQQYDGNVFVQLNPARSNAWPLRFIPAVEYRHVYGTQDAVYPSHTEPTVFALNGQMDIDVFHPNTTFGAFGGDQGTDVFFTNTALDPGWASVSFATVINGTGMPGGSGSAVVQRYSASDPSLKFNVQWSYGMWQDIDYGFDVVIAGPRGPPDGVVQR